MAKGSRLLVGLAGVCLAYLALVSTLWNLGSGLKTAGVPALLPDDPEIVMDQAIAQFRRNKGRLPQSIVRDVREAASLDPLEEEPLIFAALQRLAAGDDREALKLLEQARHRNPRSRETRIALLSRYLTTNRPAAVREAGVISRLLPESRDALVPVLAKLARDNVTDAATVRALRSSPLRISVLQKLAQHGASARLLMAISADLRGKGSGDEGANWVGGVVETVAKRDDLVGAKRLWSHFYAVDPAQGGAAPFDGDFAGLAGPPFGWRVSSGPAGVAEIAGGALRVQYYGRDPAEFARQLLGLAPGAYRLHFETSQSRGARPADLVWQVACLGGGEPLLRLPLAASSSRFGTASDGNFIVPQGECRAQWLVLLGQPSLEPETRSAEINSLVIERR